MPRKLMFAISFLTALIFSVATNVHAEQPEWVACRDAHTPADRIAACTRAIAALKSKPLLERAYLRRGNANREAGSFAEAVADYTRLIALHPGVAGYYDNRQAAYRELGNFEAALNDANATVNLSPTLSFPFRSRGLLFESAGRYAEALSDFTSAAKIDTNDAGLRILRGRALSETGKLDEALQEFAAALVIDPKATAAVKERAVAFDRAGNITAAVADLEAYVRAEPTDSDSATLLVQFRAKAGAAQVRDVSPAPVIPAAVDATQRPIQAGSEAARFLQTICATKDINGVKCSNARNYPIADQTCNVDLVGDVYHVKSYTTEFIVAPYTSDCEPHATNYGGSIVGEVTGGQFVFKSYVQGEVLGDKCVVEKNKYEDTLYCIFDYYQMGTSETSLQEYRVDANGSGAYSIRNTTRVSAENGKGNTNYYSVRCASRIQYFHLEDLQAGETPNTLSMRVEYADAPLIRQACTPGTPIPSDATGKPDEGEAFLAPAKAKIERFIFDIEAGTFASVVSYAQPAAPAASAGPANLIAPADKRIALVIGNSSYSATAALPNPAPDAQAVADSFRALGFKDVTLVQDANHEAMLKALAKFADDATGADWAVIYYAGHGIEIGGKNYLVPVDASLKTDRQIGFEAISLDQVMDAASGATALRLVLLDACRNNPFASTMRLTSVTRSAGRGLARVEPSVGTMVVFAARDGQVAADGDANGHSPFTQALLDQAAQPNVEINLMFRRVRDEVLQATSNEQEPFVYGSLPGKEFYFARAK